MKARKSLNSYTRANRIVANLQYYTMSQAPFVLNEAYAQTMGTYPPLGRNWDPVF